MPGVRVERPRGWFAWVWVGDEEDEESGGGVEEKRAARGVFVGGEFARPRLAGGGASRVEADPEVEVVEEVGGARAARIGARRASRALRAASSSASASSVDAGTGRLGGLYWVLLVAEADCDCDVWLDEVDEAAVLASSIANSSSRARSICSSFDRISCLMAARALGISWLLISFSTTISRRQAQKDERAH